MYLQAQAEYVDIDHPVHPTKVIRAFTSQWYTVQYLVSLLINVPTDTLRRHAYSNILQILPPKNKNFQIKNSDIFQISAQNIDCGQSMFLSRNKKNNVYPCKPQLYYIKVGLKGVKIT